jgi:hypothetical protein
MTTPDQFAAEPERYQGGECPPDDDVALLLRRLWDYGHLTINEHYLLESQATRIGTLEQRIRELSGALRERGSVIDAAIVWAFCPAAGGYKDGPAVEDTCEALGAAVNAMLGTDIATPADEWWTLDEMRRALASSDDAGQGDAK